ncbi:hypothetical protein [Metabacillus fastidiosus]|uniref:hypothetical protein n=1 Tax=Metabacillus fastidiosus TaxID=1458 RepID=UPI002E1EE24A|nr:hypothetical protein [Metabacillus fastidiosus]
MPFFPSNPGRRPFPPDNRRHVRPVPAFRRQPGYRFSPNQTQQTPPSQGLSSNLGTMMGHVGKVANGINMMRQIGSIISLFR